MSLRKASHVQCQKIIQLLKEAREQRGLSKYVVAQRSGLSQQAIGYMEKGHRIPSFETILAVAMALDVDLADVITRARKQLQEARRS